MQLSSPRWGPCRGHVGMFCQRPIKMSCWQGEATRAQEGAPLMTQRDRDRLSVLKTAQKRLIRSCRAENGGRRLFVRAAYARGFVRAAGDRSFSPPSGRLHSRCGKPLTPAALRAASFAMRKTAHSRGPSGRFVRGSEGASHGSEPRTAGVVRQNGGQSERSPRGGVAARAAWGPDVRAAYARGFVRGAENRSLPRPFGPLRSRL
jgi:hypothetical protein